MSERGIHGEHGEYGEQTPHLDCFPVTRAVVDQVLHGIERNPDAYFHAEGNALDEANNTLFKGLQSLAKHLNLDFRSFLEGAVFAHGILREQALAAGQSVPVISSDAWMLHLRDQRDGPRDKELTPIEHGMEQFADLAKKDQHFATAITTLTNYRLQRRTIIYGAVNVYLPFRKAHDIKQMEAHYK